MHSGNDAPSNGTVRIDGWFEPRRIILLIATRGAISDSLIGALEREFPWAVVEQAEHIDAACAKFGLPVGLILIDAAFLKAAEEVSADILLNHPLAFTAAIEFDDHNPICSFPEMLGSRLIRGVLPMNLRLDVWLSVIRLMLRGGEYFPASMFHEYRQRNRSRLENLRLTSSSAPALVSKFGDLTARETQVLERVSQGLQNKTIAAEFNLSEHTVKVHLHNILAKLGAHNRTDASARFRERQLARSTQANSSVQWTASRRDVAAEESPSSGADQES